MCGSSDDKRPKGLVSAWLGLLRRVSPHGWAWFATLTFAETTWRYSSRVPGGRFEASDAVVRGVPVAKHPEAADKAFRVWVSLINRQAHGRNWWRRGRSVSWVRGIERTKAGRIHFHALIGGDLGRLAYPATSGGGVVRLSTGDGVRLRFRDGEAAVRHLVRSWWEQRFGFARVERPRSQADVQGYVIKYVLKGGEVDFCAPAGTRSAELGLTRTR